MDLFKALTGKNPAEFEKAARILVDTPDIDLFKKLVKQDDFLFDFIKNNVAKRIRKACNKNNYLNLLQFLDYYSPSYDSAIMSALYEYGGIELLDRIKELFLNGNEDNKAYALKYFSMLPEGSIEDIMPEIRAEANSENEYISNNAIEVLSTNNDSVSKEEAIQKLLSEDEFEQYNAVKFLVTYGAKDALPKIFKVMKNSSLSENIAAEIPFLVDLETLLEDNFESALLILCNIINAIPEILPPSAAIDYNLFEILENLYRSNLTSSSALLLRMAKDKFAALAENEEYLFDVDKNTKDEIVEINKFLNSINVNKLNSLLYDELYDESDFVFFALDFVDEIEELETLLDSKNQTLLLKVLTILKDKQALNDRHKELALHNISNEDIKHIVEVL